MKHIRSITVATADAGDVGPILAVIGAATGAFVSIYSTIWFTKNWEQVLDAVMDEVDECGGTT